MMYVAEAEEEEGEGEQEEEAGAGTKCTKLGLPGKLILIERKGLLEVIFS